MPWTAVVTAVVTAINRLPEWKLYARTVQKVAYASCKKFYFLAFVSRYANKEHSFRSALSVDRFFVILLIGTFMCCRAVYNVASKQSGEEYKRRDVKAITDWRTDLS